MKQIPVVGPLLGWAHRLLNWAYRHPRRVADWTARGAFVLATWLGWRVVGYPWADGGHVQRLLHGGLVVVGAFLLAAMVQMVLLGDYSLTAGPFKIKGVKVVKEVTDETAAATVELVKRMDGAENRLQQLRADVSKLEGSVVKALDEIATQLPQPEGP